MIILGVVCLIVGYVLPLPLVFTVGEILVVVGLILLLLGGIGHPVLGRRHYW